MSDKHMSDDNAIPMPKKYHLFAGAAWDYDVQAGRMEYYRGEFDTLEAAYKALPLPGKDSKAYLAELRDGKYVEVCDLTHRVDSVIEIYKGGDVPCNISWRFLKNPRQISPDDEYIVMERHTRFIPPFNARTFSTGHHPSQGNGDPMR